MTTPQDRTLGVLTRAREYLQRGWVQDATARDIHGKPVRALADTAVAWSLLGCLAPAGEGDVWAMMYAIEAINSRIHPIPSMQGLHRFNDSHTREEVLSLVDDVINSVKST